MAINFPDSPNNNDLHTVGGVTWKWDGTTWLAQGGTQTYSLPTASSTQLGGVKVGNNLSIDGSGVLSASGGSSYTNSDVDTHLNTSSAGTGQILSWNGSDYDWVADQTGGGGGGGTISDGDKGDVVVSNTGTTWLLDASGVTAGSYDNATITVDAKGRVTSASSGSGLNQRTTDSVTFNSLADGASVTGTLDLGKSYNLLKVETSHAAWVTMYIDAASRTNDQNRNIETDALPGAGIIAEIVTTGDTIQNITPGVVGWNNDGSTFCYLKVVNNSGNTANLTITATFVVTEK